MYKKIHENVVRVKGAKYMVTERDVRLWVVGTQFGIQMMHYRIVHPKPI